MFYLKYSDLSLPKLNSDMNQWADHIEFFCLIAQDESITEEQIVDRLLDESSNDASVAVEDVAEEDEIDELVSTLKLNDEELNDAIIDESQDNAALKDKVSSKINIYFSLLRSRQIKYNEDYPFLVGNNNITLKEDLSSSQKLYLILLCSSLLRLATQSGLNKLGHHFEELCGPVFKKLTPLNTKNIFFGSGGNIEPSISGTFYSKVLQLCDLLHVSPRSNFTKENAGLHNVGDGGLDWVGIYDFSDCKSSQPVFFGQCACGSDWKEKEFDAHISKWNKYIQFESGYLTYHFIPRSIRDESLDWFNPLDIYEVVLVDRYRLIELLKTENNLSEIIQNTYRDFLTEVNNNKIDSFM